MFKLIFFLAYSIALIIFGMAIYRYQGDLFIYLFNKANVLIDNVVHKMLNMPTK